MLVKAICGKDPDKVRECLPGASEILNKPAGEIFRFFPLLWAVFLEHKAVGSEKDKLKDIVVMLKAAGADFNHVVCHQTVLTQAVENVPHLVKPLIEEHGASLIVPDAINVLWMAALRDDEDTYRYLLTKGADPKLRDFSGKNVYERAQAWPAELLRPALVEKIRLAAMSSSTPLHHSVSASSESMEPTV